MLPLGRIGIRAERGVDRQSLFTHDEQVTLMTLWSIARSPLMFGGDLPSNDEFTLSLLTNADVLKVNQASEANTELQRDGELVVWAAKSSDSEDRYLALFNLGERADQSIEVDLSRLGAGTRFDVRDLWRRSELGIVQGVFRQQIPAHGAKLYRLRPV